MVALEIEAVLETAGYQVTGVADSIGTALEIMASSKPELAVVDVNLVGGDSGIELALKLRDQGIPLLLATRNCSPNLSSEVAIGCLTKPFHALELAAAVEVAFQVVKGDPALFPHRFAFSDRILWFCDSKMRR